MSKRVKCCFLILLIPFMVSGQSFDTTNVLKQLADDLKGFKNTSYNYTMEAIFPNKDVDTLNGLAYLDTDNKVYYNDCKSFTMIYSGHWFYKADHRNKILTIINLDKDVEQKLKIKREKQLFLEGAANAFFDSIILNTATIRKYKLEGDVEKITLSFPKAYAIQKIDMSFNTSSHSMVSYEIMALQPLERTSKGILSAEVRSKLFNFKKITDKSIYNQDNYFTYKKNKLELKKYNNYKLSTKV